MAQKVFVIHDVLDLSLCDSDEYVVFDANNNYAFCKGCFDCWLRTPGKCIMKDKVCGLNDNLVDCNKFVIISKPLYGGFSTKVKGVIDRLIAFNLPFFKTINGELHHKPRNKNPFELKVIFYGDITDNEMETAKEYVSNLAFNFDDVVNSVEFVKDAESVGGLL